jgi:hypothetical protein
LLLWLLLLLLFWLWLWWWWLLLFLNYVWKYDHYISVIYTSMCQQVPIKRPLRGGEYKALLNVLGLELTDNEICVHFHMSSPRLLLGVIFLQEYKDSCWQYGSTAPRHWLLFGSEGDGYDSSNFQFVLSNPTTLVLVLHFLFSLVFCFSPMFSGVSMNSY